MASLSTEDFPYTMGYVQQLLNVEESELRNFVKVLGLAPKVDEHTGRMIFSHRETEILRKAIDMNRRGEDLTLISRQFSPGASEKPGAQLPAGPSGRIAAAKSGQLKAGKENLAVIVEAVSSAKEGILKDMSRLLDDKLTGLDEVVVELIRCKSENDTLKQKLKAMAAEKDVLQDELNRYKPAGFGFFRKV